MLQVNMYEAKNGLSRLVKLLETEEEDVIYIARDGQEIAQLTLIPKKNSAKRIGAAEGKIDLPDDFDDQFSAADSEILTMFEGGLDL